MWNLPFSRKGKQGAAVPAGVRIYAVGDVHGRLDLLTRLFSAIDADLAARPVSRPIHVFLGDYVDRGPASRQVIDSLIDRSQFHEMVCLKGNHEALLAEFLCDPGVLETWQEFGGMHTLLSYGIAVNRHNHYEQARAAKALAEVLPQSHQLFLSTLRSWFICGDFYFVHAGIRPGVPLEEQDDADLLWIRDDFLSSDDDFGKIVVHGHTPVEHPEVRPNRINLDTGAYATGRLTCLIIDEDRLSLARA